MVSCAAEVTTNQSLRNDPACMFVDVTTPEGQATGLPHDSVLSALVVAAVYPRSIDHVLGSLSPRMMQAFDDCPKVALELS